MFILVHDETGSVLLNTDHISEVYQNKDTACSTIYFTFPGIVEQESLDVTETFEEVQALLIPPTQLTARCTNES